MSDEQDDDKARWVMDPHTQRLLESAKKKRAEAIENLINGCRATSDIRVMEQYQKYALLDGVCRMLKGEQ